MSGNYNKKRSSSQKTPSNDNKAGDELALASQYLEIQYKNAEIDAQKIEFENESLDKDFKLANKSMDIQRELLLKKPGDDRKNFIMICTAIVVLLLLIGGFIIWLLSSGNKDYANQILSAVSYIVVSGLSFYFGKKTKTKKNNDISDAEIVD